ncbi:MAG: thioredoxin family protein [Lentimicrobium sp.]|jgi:peroxiredoxin|nr:thioredoxin family protein [Lentimicrobium sp.]
MYYKSTIAAISFFALLMLFSCNSSAPDQGVYIGGILSQNNRDQLVLYLIDTVNFHAVDSVKPNEEGEFSFFLKTDTTGFYFLGNRSYFTPAFVAFPGDSIRFVITKNHTIDVNGGREAEAVSGFMHSLSKGKLRIDSLFESVQKARYNGDYARARLEADAALKLITDSLKEKALNFIQVNPFFLSNMLILNANPGGTMLFDESIDYPLFIRADSLLQTYHQTNTHAVFFHHRVTLLRARVEAMNRTKELLDSGKIVPDIVLEGTSGKPTGLHEKKGKLTLIYFWNPAESLSRQSNVRLKQLYEKCKSKDFSVFAVSFDTDVDRFKSVVEMDKLWWDNVNDTLGRDSPVLQSYAINEFPSFVLMDEQKKAVGVFLSVEALGLWMEDNFLSDF